MRLLIVEADRDLANLLAFMLTHAGFEPLIAHDGPAALALLEREQPALLLLDSELGSEDGMELLGQIRRRGDVPVIVLSARTAEDDKVAAFDLGADDYMT